MTDARTITIQPALMSNGVLPYPFHVTATTGEVQRQDFWNGRVASVIGFVDTFESTDVTVHWREVPASPERVIGKYVVVSDSNGQWSTLGQAIESVRVTEPEPSTTI